MKKREITKEEKEDLQEIFSIEKEEDSKEVKISVDRDQFTIRIPKDFAREMNIDPNKDVFKFLLMMEEKEPNKKRLHADLIKNENQEKNN